MCAYKLNNARYENLFAHTVAVMRLHLSINHNLLLIFTFLENAFVCVYIVYVLNFPLNPLGK